MDEKPEQEKKPISPRCNECYQIPVDLESNVATVNAIREEVKKDLETDVEAGKINDRTRQLFEYGCKRCYEQKLALHMGIDPFDI